MKKLVRAMLLEYFDFDVDIKVKIKSGMDCYAMFKGGYDWPEDNREPLQKTYRIDLSLDHMVLKDSIRETILHELIHAEQWHYGYTVTHDAYFYRRAKQFGIKGA